MTPIQVSESALTGLRIATSPLWEVFGGLGALAQPGPSPWPHGEWERDARRVLAGGRAAELIAWTRRLPSIPELLTPVPHGTDSTIEDELRHLRHAIRQAPPRRLADLRIGPAQADEWSQWLLAGIRDYWRRALAPYWPAMHTALRDEALHRALLLATAGGDAALTDLDPRLRWQAPVLQLPGPPRRQAVRCDTRLIIVPMVFAHRAVRRVSTGGGVVAVGYQADGAAILTKRRQSAAAAPPDVAGDPLALLLGRGRAAVLRGLTEPATTSELAASLAMSASTVSQHLSTLVAADVAHRRREGGRVLYSLDRAGIALLRYLHTDGDQDPG